MPFRIAAAGLLAAAALVTAHVGHGDGQKPFQLADVLPPQTLLVVSAPDLDAAHKMLMEKSALGAQVGLFKPFVEAMLRGLQGQMDEVQKGFEKESGISVMQLVEALRGGLELALVEMSAEGGPPVMFLRVASAGREEAVKVALAALHKVSGEEAKAAPEKHKGIEVQAVGNPPVFYAFVNGSLLAGTTKASFLPALDRALGVAPTGPGMTLAASDHFKATRARTAGGSPILSVYVNAGTIVEMAMEDASESDKPVLEAFGLSTLKAAELSISFDGARGIATRLYLHAPVTGARGGLLGVIDHGPVDPALVRLVPVSGDGIILKRLDLNKLLTRVIDLVAAVEPSAQKDADESLGEFKKEVGFDLRADFLASLGDDWAVVSFAPSAGGLSFCVTSVAVKDAAKLEMCLNKVATVLRGEQVAVELAGKKIRYALCPLGELGDDPFEALERGPEGLMAPLAGLLLGQSWTIDGGRLYLAMTPQTLADYFEHMAKGPSQDKDLAAGVAALAKSSGVVCWQRSGMTSSFDVLAKILKQVEPNIRMLGVAADANLLPRGKDLAKHTMPTTLSLGMDAQGLLFETRGVTGGLEVGALLGLVAAGGVFGQRSSPPQVMTAHSEPMALATLRMITSAQVMFHDGDMDGDGVADYAASLDELISAGVLDASMSGGAWEGYMFLVSGSEQGYTIEAHPLSPGETGTRFFYVDQTGVIREEYWQPAGPNSQPSND